MLNFGRLSVALTNNFEMLRLAYGTPYQTNADPEKLWETYLGSFPDGTNPLYRKRTEHDCSCCRHFIKSVGGLVFIGDDLAVHTIWDFQMDGDDAGYQPVLNALNAYVRQCQITDVWLTEMSVVGTRMSRALVGETMVKFEHFWVSVPQECRCPKAQIGTKLAEKRADVQVFDRSLREISLEAVDTVMELAQSRSLYKGEEWLPALRQFRGYQVDYDKTPEDKKALFAWKKAATVSAVVTRMRNHSIGVLLQDISNGADLDTAVRRYEKVVAPANYKRPKAIFTAKMLEEAKKTVQELGYMNSLQRKYASLDDVSVSDVLFADRIASKRMLGGGDVFETLKADAKKPAKPFSKAEEIPIDRFLSDVLPGAKAIEALVENRHERNFVSLIAPVVKDSPSMFKWKNGFGWAYTGNMTDSDIRENVKNAGGNVDGVLRFSIQWNDTDEFSQNDLDAHCVEPSGFEIYYGDKVSRQTLGNLDVDIIHPIINVPAVENITWPDKSLMRSGTYKFFVHQFTNRGGRDGFRAEIAFGGQTFRYDYRKELRNKEKVDVALVTLAKDGTFSIKHLLPMENSPREIWGVRTQEFIPVTAIMSSPNYWEGEQGVGNRHWFFMLKGCVNPERPNGFYNEFLKPELEKHKRVFEALGGKMAVAETDDQMSGLGFNSTTRNSLIVKVHGATERIMKVLF